MLKNLIHSLVAFGLILTACRPATPPPTPIIRAATPTPVAAAPEAIETPEPTVPQVMTRRLVANPDAERQPSFFLHFNRPMDPGAWRPRCRSSRRLTSTCVGRTATPISI